MRTTSNVSPGAVARRRSWRGAVPGAALLLALATSLAGPLAGVPVAAQEVGADAWAKIDEILDNPAAYYGRRVTVSGEVGEILGPRSFRLEDSDLVFEEAIPVVGARPLRAPGGRAVGADFFGDREVRVIGEVRQFNLRSFEEQLGVDLDDNLWAEFAGRPAIVAREVIAEDDAVGPAAGARPGVGTGAATVGVNDILADPNRYYGRNTPLTFTAAVERALGPRSFLVRGPGNRLLPIVMPWDGGPIDANRLVGQQVRVTGTLNQFNLAAFEERVGLDLDDRVWAPYAGQPALIASAVGPIGSPVGAGAASGAVAAPAVGADVYRILGIAPGAAPVTNVTVDDITDDPAAYAGQYVSVTGEIEEVISGRSFTIEDSDLLFDEALRVIGAVEFPGLGPLVGGVGVGPGVGTGFALGDEIRVNGVVRTFNLVAFERDFGVDLDDNLYRDWEGQAVLIATELLPAADDLGY